MSITDQIWLHSDKLITRPERIAANLDVRELSQEDFEALDKMDRGPDGRTCDLGPRWGVKVF